MASDQQQVTKSALIYTRRSTEKQDNTHESQELECRAWAALKGYSPRAVFRDDCSGTVPVTDRQGFLAAVNELCPGEVLIIKRRDRLGRDAMVNALAESFINRQGGRIITTEIGEENTAESQLIKGIMDQFAQFELALIRQRTKAALSLRKSKGLLTGQAPLGKKSDPDGNLINNSEEQTWLTKAREMRNSELTLTEITQRLKEAGCLSRSGRPPSRSTVAYWCKGIKVLERRGGARSGSGRPPHNNNLIDDMIMTLHHAGLSLRQITRHMSRYPEARTSNGKPLAMTQIARIIQRSKESLEI